MKISEERAEHACNIAAEFIEQMVLDGNNNFVIYTIFSIGLAAYAHTMGLTLEKYLEGCKAAYEDLQK